MKEFPTLYHKDSLGRLRSWSVWAKGNVVYSDAGLVDGAKIRSSYECQATNVGRSNMRTPEQQAEFMAASDWKHKLDRKYRTTPEEAMQPLSRMPMLAQPYNPKKHVKMYRMQPKLDGVRALSFWGDDDRIHMVSRSGQDWNFPEIEKALASVLPKGCAVDGEVYKHGTKLQKVTSLARGHDGADLQYWMYDMPIVEENEDLPQVERLQMLKEFFDVIKGDDLEQILRLTPTTFPLPVAECLEWEKWYVAQGFEGGIGRADDGQYRYAARSHDVIKFKSFDDTEFEVVGSYEGEGKDAGAIVFICKNDINDKTFGVRPAASYAERQRMWQNREQYVGKMYTVKHMKEGRTEEGLRYCMTGKCFRHEKDLEKK